MMGEPGQFSLIQPVANNPKIIVRVLEFRRNATSEAIAKVKRKTRQLEARPVLIFAHAAKA
jgi:hypothetical protein